MIEITELLLPDDAEDPGHPSLCHFSRLSGLFST